MGEGLWAFSCQGTDPTLKGLEQCVCVCEKRERAREGEEQKTVQ